MAERLGEVHRRMVEALTRPGAPFEVAEVEVEGRPTRVYAKADRDMTAIFAEVETAHGGKTLVVYEERSWTCGEVMAEARRLAGSLAARYGVGPGSRVGLAMRNRPEWFSGFIAIQRLGAVAVLFNSRGAAAELEAAAAQTDCHLIIADERRAELFVEAHVKAALAVVADAPRQNVVTFAELAAPGLPEAPAAVRWSPEIGQVAKVGSTERKDGPDDGEAEAIFG